MKHFSILRKPVVALLAMGLCLFTFTTTTLAHAQKAATSMATSTANGNGSGNNSGGTGRSGDGQPLRVMVIYNGKPFANAHIAISVADGSVVLRGTTKANGVFVTTSLDQGVYTVTATTVHDTASSPVTLVQSTDPAIVSLTLAKK